MTAFARTFAAAALVLAASAVAEAARADDDCYGLWFFRNLIYAQNGYCFKTQQAQEVFADYQCWTRNPQLTELP